MRGSFYHYEVSLFLSLILLALNSTSSDIRYNYTNFPLVCVLMMYLSSYLYFQPFCVLTILEVFNQFTVSVITVLFEFKYAILIFVFLLSIYFFVPLLTPSCLF